MVNIMSVRPIDMQTLLPKLQSMKFAKELEINKHNNDMNDLNKETKAMSEQKSNKIIEAERKEADKLKNDTSKNKNSNNKSNQKKKEKEKKSKEKRITKSEGNRFDMKV
jgi:hypothetical protein